MPMVRGIWPALGGNGISRSAVQADWMALPFSDRSCDFVPGDGCYSLLRPTQALALGGSLRHMLGAGGTFLYRAFVFQIRG